jgi:transposase-like protein
MSKKIKEYHSNFKFKVCLESFINGNVSETARKFGVNANQLSTWRGQFNEKGHIIFESQNSDREKTLSKKINDLENLIGKKEIEIALLKKYLDFYAPPDGS